MVQEAKRISQVSLFSYCGSDSNNSQNSRYGTPIFIISVMYIVSFNLKKHYKSESKDAFSLASPCVLLTSTVY